MPAPAHTITFAPPAARGKRQPPDPPAPPRPRQPRPAPAPSQSSAAYTSAFIWPRKLNVPEGSSCVMNTTASSSVGSTQNVVDAAPPHMNSPAEPTAPLARGPFDTATVSPNPVPAKPTSP